MKTKLIFQVYLFVIFSQIPISCKKTNQNQQINPKFSVENISFKEIEDWEKTFSEKLVIKPRFINALAQKRVFNNRLYIRVPILEVNFSDNGFFYFTKEKDSMIVRFIMQYKDDNSSEKGKVAIVDFSKRELAVGIYDKNKAIGFYKLIDSKLAFADVFIKESEKLKNQNGIVKTSNSGCAFSLIKLSNGKDTVIENTQNSKTINGEIPKCGNKGKSIWTWLSELFGNFWAELSKMFELIFGIGADYGGTSGTSGSENSGGIGSVGIGSGGSEMSGIISNGGYLNWSFDDFFGITREYSRWAQNDPNSFQNKGIIFNPDDPFANLEYPVDAPDIPIIENGIVLEEITDDRPIKNRVIATTTKRNNGNGNVEDLTFGYNANPIGLEEINLLSDSDFQLFNKMKNLFYYTTFFSKDLYFVGTEMIEKFRNKTGGIYSSPILNQKVSFSNETQNFLMQFAYDLNERLIQTKGDLEKVSQFELSYRPQYKGLKNLFNGLQILINDTESSKIEIENYKVDAYGNWQANLRLTIIDHFGLDKNDMIKYQSNHVGFPAWWLLQHTRGYIPFKTEIVVLRKAKGRLN